MPRVVLYTTDLIPITVIELPNWGLDMMRNGLRFRVPVMEPICSKSDPIPENTAVLRHVDIWGEPFYRGHVKSMILFTDDEEYAMKLSSVPLPGQQKEWNAMEQEKQRFINALLRVLGG